MVFVDRVSGQPNRYALTTEEGNKYYVTLERADNPITEGTPLNAETFNDMLYELDFKINDNMDVLSRTIADGDAHLWSEIERVQGRVDKTEALYIQSSDYPGCYYRMVDGEKEWLNPPSVPHVEYRTTERLDSSPVYMKRLTYNIVAAGANTEVVRGADSIKTVVCCEGVLSAAFGSAYGHAPLPAMDSNGPSAWLTFSGKDVVIHTSSGSNYAGFCAYITLKYTKQ